MYFREQFFIETKIVQHFFRKGIGFEIPEDAFRKCFNSGIDLAGKLHAYKVARQHHVADPVIELRFVLFYPGEFAGSEVAG